MRTFSLIPVTIAVFGCGSKPAPPATPDAHPIVPTLRVTADRRAAHATIDLPDMPARWHVTLTAYGPDGVQWTLVERDVDRANDLVIPGGYRVALDVPLDTVAPPPPGRWRLTADDLAATFDVP